MVRTYCNIKYRKHMPVKIKPVDIFKSMVHMIGFDERDPLVLSFIDEMNMKIAIPVAIYTLIMERFMYNRTVILWGLMPKFQYNLCFGIVSAASILLLVYSIIYLSAKKRRNDKLSRVVLYLFVAACFIAGQTIAVYDYAIRKQVFVFLPMVAWIFALMLINPMVTLIGSYFSFIFIPEYTNNRVTLTSYVDHILLIFAVMMILVSLVRWINQIHSSRTAAKVSVMNDQLKEISLKDELTGVKNRYALRQDFRDYVGKELMVVMADIDDFKFYNDTYGHETGDAVLKHMAETMCKCFGRDSVYRFGGDEFLLVLIDWDEADTTRGLAEWKVRFHNFTLEDRVLHLSSTAGYTYGFCSSEDEIHQMISVADARLYDGKMDHKGMTIGCPFEPGKTNEEESLEKIQESLRSGEMDSLTKVPNLMYFRSKADLTADILRSSGKEPVLAYLNLTNFKHYNRKYGFEAGDNLLAVFAKYLKEAFPDDLVCRFADDHFAVLATRSGIEEKIGTVNDQIAKESGGARVGVKAGLYALADDTVDVGLACDCARQAMELEDDNRHFSWYDETMRERLERKQYIIDHFEEALAKKWIEVVYQPVIRSVNRYVCGVEVLPRWNDPEHGIIEPEIYVPILEEAHMIFEHDIAVLRQACLNFEDFGKTGNPAVPFIVNLSYRDFDHGDLLERIGTVTSGIDHAMIHFDISASAMRRSGKELHDFLHELAGEGYQLWMDGFGSENSAIDVLYEFPMHGIKIDIRLLHDFHPESPQAILLHHVISLCKELNISTLALGVENEEEERFLVNRGCEYMQGFWFSENVTYEQCLSGEFRDSFTFEPINMADYYFKIGHVDLSRPTRLDQGQLKNVSDELPAAICEYREGRFTVLRRNREFLPFLKTVGIPSIDVYEARMNEEGSSLRTRLIEVCASIRKNGGWETMTLGKEGKLCTGSFHLFRKIPSTMPIRCSV